MKQQSISLATAILMNINIMVGSGILIGPGKIAGIAGAASFLAWPLAALFLLPIVMSTVQLSRMFPGEGGFYSYAKEGLSHGYGFLAGWLYIVGYTFGIAVEVLALREAFLVIFGDMWPFNALVPFSILCIGAVMAINSMSVRFLSTFLNAMTLIKLLPIVTLIVSIPLFLKGGFSLSLSEVSHIPFALTLPLFGFLGFEYCSSISHLIEDSKKNAPRAILFGFLITVGLYTLFNFGLLQLMGVSALQQYGASVFVNYMAISSHVLKTALMAIVSGASVLTLFAGAIGMLYANATLLQSLASKGVLIRSTELQRLNRAGRPWFAIRLQALVALIVALLLPQISLVGSLTNFCVLASFILPFVSLYIMQRRNRESRWLTILAIGASLFLVGYMWYLSGTTIHERLLFLVPVILGLGIGYFVHRRS